MEEATQHLEEEVDFANYDLGDEGFERVVEYMLEQPRIVTLNLRGNQLSDKSIVLLCYYLEKYEHTELRKMVLQDNQISRVGYQALLGLSKRLKLKQIQLGGNPGLKIEEIKSLSKLE